jgi:hypothetical protein
MRDVIANAPTAGDKARAGLSKEESARFFGPPPLITGEDRAQYEAMRDRISAAVGPRNFVEEMLVNDVVNHVWETSRLFAVPAIKNHGSASEREPMKARVHMRPSSASSKHADDENSMRGATSQTPSLLLGRADS